MPESVLTTLAGKRLTEQPAPLTRYGLGIALKRPYPSFVPSAGAPESASRWLDERARVRPLPGFRGEVAVTEGSWDTLPRALADNLRSRIQDDALVAAHVYRSPRVRIARVSRTQQLVLTNLFIPGEATTIVFDVAHGVELDLVEDENLSRAATSDPPAGGSALVLLSLSPRACVHWQSVVPRLSGVTIVERLAHLAESATLELSEVLLAPQTLRSTTVVTLRGRGARAILRSLIVGSGDDQGDLNLRVVHDAPHTASDVRSWSVLDGKAHAVIRGCIRIAACAGGADGSQRCDTMLLSPHAEVDSIPTLEIHAHDVRCSHGATSGRLNAEHLFYLQSRGLSPAAARRLLVTAFVRNALTAFTEEKQRLLLERVAALCLPRQQEAGESRAE